MACKVTDARQKNVKTIAAVVLAFQAMPGRLRLEVLGGFAAFSGDAAVCRLPTRKAEALLTYLALPAGRFHPRDKLAAMLWDSVPEGQARQSLRQALGSIRRALGQDGERLVLAQGDAVALNPALVSVDAADLEGAIAEGRREALERAALLYRGDFLAGFRLPESSFEEWRTAQRERLHELALEALARLLAEQGRAGQVEAAIATAMRILAMDPLQEAVHRTLMRLLLRQGRRGMALQQYQACVVALQRELGAEPDEETRQLYREILQAVRTVQEPGLATTLRVGAGTVSQRAADAPMIGREHALGRLERALGRMLDEGGRVVLVSGEAGIGKSRLIQEFISGLAGRAGRLAFGRCRETEQTLPFRPWIEALRSDGAADDPAVQARLDATTAIQLATLFPGLRPPSAALQAGGAPTPVLLFEPLLELVGALAGDQPLILVIEDLHWADTMSARLLAFLGRRIHRWPVLVVASTRPEDLVDAPALAVALKELRDDGLLDEVTLGPLSEAETQALTRAFATTAWGRRDIARLAHEVWRASEGVPFIVVESLRHLQQTTGAAAGALGGRIHDFVAARLERLGDDPRYCVEVAAVIGRDFSFRLLARAAGLGERETARAVEALVRRRILEAVGDRLDFCHDWIRTVAYERLLPARRAALHGVIGGVLEELHHDRLDDVADQLGTHYSRAGDVRRAIPNLILFSQVAAQRYALDDANRALAQAMAAVGGLPPSERDRWALEVALHQAFVLSVLGRHREILTLLHAHAETVRRVGDLPSASEYYFRLGLSQFFLGERAHAHRAGEQALAHAERRGDDESVGKALHVLSLHAWEIGRPGEGIAMAMRAIPLLDRPHTQTWFGLAHHDLALNCLVAGRLDDALAAVARVEEIGRAASLPRLVAFAGYVGAWIQALKGETERAIETARRALSISRDSTTTVLLSGTLGYAYLEQGEAGPALSMLEDVVKQLASTPVRSAQVRHLALLAEAHLQAGDGPAARETAARALEFAVTDGTPYNAGIARRALGRIHHASGDLDAAGVWLTQALATFTECSATFEAARTRVDLAVLHAQRGEREAACEHAEAALSVFESATAPRRAESARALARSLGATRR